MVKNKKVARSSEKYSYLSESFSYIHSSRRYIYSIVLIFILFAIFGAFLPVPDFIVNSINEFIKKMVEQTASLNAPELIIFILKNNVFASLYGLFLGILFGFVPVVIAMANGYVLGYVSKLATKGGGILVLWKLLPHGIFELFAVLVSLGLGLGLGAKLVVYSNQSKSFKEFLLNLKKELILCIKTFICVILPLLVIAAIIEGSLIKVLG